MGIPPILYFSILAFASETNAVSGIQTSALSFGGKWTIHDKDSINTSFPNFLKIIDDLKK